MASQMAIKMLGTNGGGFINVNAAHPFENPTPLSNFIQMLSIFLIPAGLTYYLGRMVRQPEARLGGLGGHVRCCFCSACWSAGTTRPSGNPIAHGRWASIPADGNMEGKEVRFGIFNSALFATITTDASCGAVNSMHDSLHAAGRPGSALQHPVGRGRLRRRGRGALRHAGLRGAGRLHRRPDGGPHAGVSGQEDRVLRGQDGGSLAIWCRHSCFLLGFTALGRVRSQWRVQRPWATTGPTASARSSTPSRPASAITAAPSPGLSANTPWYNITLGLAMLFGRFCHDRAVLALAGPGAKKTVPASAGSFPVSGLTFACSSIGMVVIVGALNFFPALAWAPSSSTS